jgi:ATPase subunit of ABC transporter with duplicated ATPase domains
MADRPDVDTLESDLEHQSERRAYWRKRAEAAEEQALAYQRQSEAQASEALKWRKRAEAAEADRDRLARRVSELEATLREIADQQPKTIDWLRANGIIFDGPLGTDPDNWEHVAFSIYSDLCATDAIARAALAGDGGGA